MADQAFACGAGSYKTVPGVGAVSDYSALTSLISALAMAWPSP